MTVYTMVNSGGVNHAIVCLNSLLEHNKDKIVLRIANDGSLSSGEIEALSCAFGTCIIDSELTADEVKSFAERFPLTWAYGSKHPIFRKALHLPLIHSRCQTREPFRFIDSDILFFRDHCGIFTSEAEWDCFSEDLAVTLGLRDLIKWKTPIHGIINSGIISSHYPNYDLIESFLRTTKDTIGKIHEQFAWIISNHDRPVSLISQDYIQIENRWRRLDSSDISENCIALHLTGHRKRDIQFYLRLLDEVDCSRFIEVKKTISHPRSSYTMALLKCYKRIMHHA